jgi:hypothetical protein
LEARVWRSTWRADQDPGFIDFFLLGDFETKQLRISITSQWHHSEVVEVAGAEGTVAEVEGIVAHEEEYGLAVARPEAGTMPFSLLE